MQIPLNKLIFLKTCKLNEHVSTCETKICQFEGLVYVKLQIIRNTNKCKWLKIKQKKKNTLNH